MNIYLDTIVLRIDKIAFVDYVGKNLTRGGLESVQPTTYEFTSRRVFYSPVIQVSQTEDARET